MKLRKHSTLSYEEIKIILTNNLKKNFDIRLYSLYIQQAIEYFINELIIKNFIEPQLIIDDITLGSFHNKNKLLKSIGFYKDNNYYIIENNINLINEIRNHYTHTFSDNKNIPEEIKKKIDKMTFFRTEDMDLFNELVKNEFNEIPKSQEDELYNLKFLLLGVYYVGLLNAIANDTLEGFWKNVSKLFSFKDDIQ